MANIAYTEHYFKGSKEDLEKLKGIFETLEKYPKNRRLCNLANHLGISYDDINIRGDIEQWHYNESDGDIFLLTSSAWDSCVEFFYRLNEKYFDGELSISYRVEEPGMAIFEVHDEDSFFPERFYVSANVDSDADFDIDEIEGEYSTMEEVFDVWCNFIGKNAKDFGENLTDAKMMNIIDEYEDYKKHTYFNVYEFVEK